MGAPPEETAAAEARRDLLRAELDATPDRRRKAVLQYELGQLAKRALQSEGQAVRDFLAAYNHAPNFRPPLLALLALFERRRSVKNLVRLYDAEARSATNPREAASALASRAILTADQLGEAEEALELLKTAHTQAAESNVLALLLECQLLMSGRGEEANSVVETRADLVEDPVLSAILRLEAARERERAGDTDGAFQLLRVAATQSAALARVLEALERLARAMERYPELVIALEGRAKLALAEARGEDRGQGSGTLSLARFSEDDAANAAAAQLRREAAHIRLAKLEDPEGSLASYDAAIAARPSDPLLHYERMLARESSGDHDGASADAATLLELGLDGAAAAPLHYRRAEAARSKGEHDAAASAMRAALEADPGSAVAVALLDDLLRAGDNVAEAVDLLVTRAEAAEGESRSQRYFEGALVAADFLRDAERTRSLFEAAAAATEDARPVHREALAAALRLGDAAAADAHTSALLSAELPAGERGALLRDAHELRRLVLEDEEAADQTLSDAIASGIAQTWAPDLARVTAAERNNPKLLAEAHHALATRAADAETAAAHLCAAARSEVLAGDEETAIDTLREALGRSSSHPYAVALLEEILRSRGDADEVFRLLREAAEQADAPRAAETQLLLAGAAAEAAEDFEKATESYLEAADRDPTSFAPLLALRRLAERRNDQAQLLSALEGLSQLEVSAGEVGRHTLRLGEHYDLVSHQPTLAQGPLRMALDSDIVGLHAAVGLSMLSVDESREDDRLLALKRMTDQAAPEARRGLLREAAGAALAAGRYEAAGERLNALGALAPEDRWAAIARLRLAAEAPSMADRAGAWLTLGQATDDPEAGSELLLQGLRAHVFGAEEGATDDAVILAHDVMAVGPDSLHASVALDEALTAGDDPEGRADALGSWLGHAGAVGRTALESAYGRALVSAGRSREALEALLQVAVKEPEDLASWESIRVAARACDAWDLLVEACDRLAHITEDPELTMLLLEESAATLMDALGQDDRAERRLKRILAIDARRPIAYGRLHDLMAERGDEAGLLELVSNRIELVDDVDELAKLFYEQARLLRSLGLREEALTALDNLLILESSHVGGLALLVELQVQQENWSGAVDALRSLATAEDVPDSQRRIARLGAADFLESKLEDLPGALEELTALHSDHLADLTVYDRIALTAERLERWDDVASALEAAGALADGPEATARYAYRLGSLHADKRADQPSAVRAFERALDVLPGYLAAGEALAGLQDPTTRDSMSRRFEQAVRRELEHDPTDADTLRKLRRAAAWREDRGVELVALSALTALGAATVEEATSQTELLAPYLNAVPRGTLGDAFEQLVPPELDRSVHELARAIDESCAELDGLDPSSMGLEEGGLIGRSDLVKSETEERQEIVGLGRALGGSDSELFRGGNNPKRVDLIPHYKGRPAWVIGRDISSPLAPSDRYRIGLLAVAARMGTAALVRRGAAGAFEVMLAAAAAADAPFPEGDTSTTLGETTQAMKKSMGRRARKAIPPLVAAIQGGPSSARGWAVSAVRAARRGGLIACNDMGTGLREVLGRDPTVELVSNSPEARDLLRFWLSTGALSLRRLLGLSP